ncbi:hypothetical protein [Bdellovibrio sp. HCB2-146]|uniref:hypothetical protein n=1 Tax=Bdellovibrio sp. HCB2-146 TaxID=3394362 RepID=UPI0039BC5A2F
MQNFKNLSLIFILLFSMQARADWRALFERGGFLGKYSLGFSYEWLPEHAVNYLLGVYNIGDENYYQSNFIYRYSRWNVNFYGNDWRPLQFGFFTVVSMDNERYFFRSPGKYPYPKYYDETAFRYGAEFSSTLTFHPSRVAIGYHLRVFDNGLIAAFNNSNRDLQYYISSGLSLQYLF